MRIGVDYYPEHWPRERWDTDARMMQQAGIRVVRLAEFSWSLLEPTEDCFDFLWLDEAISLFSQYGIRVIMSTPTAASPKWLVDAYPSILQQDVYGHIKQFGGRRHYCMNSPFYAQKAAVIVQKLAAHYGNHPAVEAWQIDNEFGNENSAHCYCDECERQFRIWLEEKYKTIDQLNHTYGTVFWSQIYNSFGEIVIPRASQCENSCPETRGLNPSLLLDYLRFSSDSIVRFQQMQLDILREYTSVPITTNFMGTFPEINYFDLAKNLDFVSWDNYIDTQWGKAKPSQVSLSHSLMRGLNKKAPFWVMEQQSGPCGWSKMGANPAPGKLRLWTYQSIANGAETVMYFRWRTALFGTEQYWHGILNHDGGETRRYREIAQTGAELDCLNRQLGSLTFSAKAAIIKSYDSLWSHRIHSHAQGFHYDGLLDDLYACLFDSGVETDFVSPYEDFAKYSVLIAPALNVVDEEMANRLERYVADGGQLILTYRSGTKTSFNTMAELPAPGLFQQLVGAVAADFDPLGERSVPISSIFGSGTASIWADILNPTTAQVLATYEGGYYAGQPCITENAVGRGRVYYIGCGSDQTTYHALLNMVCKQACVISEWEPLPADVEAHKAHTIQGKTIWFLLNHKEEAAMIKLPKLYWEYLTEKTVHGVLRMEPCGVAVLGEA